MIYLVSFSYAYEVSCRARAEEARPTVRITLRVNAHRLAPHLVPPLLRTIAETLGVLYRVYYLRIKS